MGTFNIKTIQAGGGRSLANVQLFVEPGTWTKPTDVDYIYVEVIGGGGGGGHGSAANPNPAGLQGGCGGFGIGYMDVQNLDPGSVPVTVGNGGVGGGPTVAPPAAAATNGTGSSFGTYLVSTFGTAGASGPGALAPAIGVSGSASGPAMVWNNYDFLNAGAPQYPSGQQGASTNPSYEGAHHGAGVGLGSMNFGLSTSYNLCGLGGAGGAGSDPGPKTAGRNGGAGQVRVWGYSSS
jgi:hypothetical protein